MLFKFAVILRCRDEDLKDLIESLKLSSKKLIIFTVNDNDDLSGGDSGTHWSLIVYDRSKNTLELDCL